MSPAPEEAARRWAVFLRAVNGAPANRLRMDDLRRRVAACGFADVETYIATGNVVLTAPAMLEADDVARLLDDGLAATGLVRTDAVVRTPEEVRALVAGDPFAAHPPQEWRRAVTLLRAPPQRDGREALERRGVTVVGADDRVVLCAFPREQSAAGLPVETAYRVVGTTRWWNVVQDFAARHLG